VKDFNPDEVAVAFDLGHSLITHGDGWKGHFEKLKPHIRIFYIKDTKRSSGFVPFGEGEFGQTDFFAQLKKMNYREPFSVHIEFDWAGKGNPKTPQALVKALKDCRRVLEQWYAQA
jgi:sugar phosphate isomerase/epimerase